MATNEAASSPRRAADGDIASDLRPEGIEHHVVTDAIDGSTGTLVHSVQDVLEHADHEERIEVARWLDAVLAGTSEDDLSNVRTALSTGTMKCTGHRP